MIICDKCGWWMHFRCNGVPDDDEDDGGGGGGEPPVFVCEGCGGPAPPADAMRAHAPRGRG
jgi:hypothetical protein